MENNPMDLSLTNIVTNLQECHDLYLPICMGAVDFNGFEHLMENMVKQHRAYKPHQTYLQ